MASTAPATALIAIDWGTSAARGYRLSPAGDVLEARNGSLGIQAVPRGGYAEALASLVGDWREDAVPIIACGMIGSRQGWVEAPYLACPASLGALARAVVHPAGVPLAIIPGLMTRDAANLPDVMRGEETQLVGSIGEIEDRVLAVLPGTHSKWARVERGTVVDFATFMTGELYAVLLEHSILGRMAERGTASAPNDAFDRGCARGLDAGGLTHDLFGARTLALTQELSPADVGEWLSGLLIGREIRDAHAWASRVGMEASRVRVVGSAALTGRYIRALGQADLVVERGPDAAAAHGMWQIASAAGLLDPARTR